MDRERDGPPGPTRTDRAVYGGRATLRLRWTRSSASSAAAVTPVPETPPFVLGLVNLAGQLLPVFSLRRCPRFAGTAPSGRRQVCDRAHRAAHGWPCWSTKCRAERGHATQTVPWQLRCRRSAGSGSGQDRRDIILIYDLGDFSATKTRIDPPSEGRAERDSLSPIHRGEWLVGPSLQERSYFSAVAKRKPRPNVS